MNDLILAIIFTIIGTVCAALGQICLKIASPRMSISKDGLIKNLPFLAGLFLYGMSMTLCIIAFKFGDLTILNPMGALNYVWAAFLSMRLLDEKMNLWKWSGIILIIIGVIVIVK